MSMPACLGVSEIAHDDVEPDSGGRVLGALLVPQQDSQWCWAAVSSMVTTSVSPAEAVPQKHVVSGLLGAGKCVLGAKKPANCCADLAAAAYAVTTSEGRLPNSPARLGCGLTFVLRSCCNQNGTVPLETIKECIDVGQPVGMHIASGGSGHFVVITGYDGDGYIRIFDPWPVATCHCKCANCTGGVCADEHCQGDECLNGDALDGGTIAWTEYDTLLEAKYHGAALSGMWDWTYFAEAAPEK